MKKTIPTLLLPFAIGFTCSLLPNIHEITRNFIKIETSSEEVIYTFELTEKETFYNTPEVRTTRHELRKRLETKDSLYNALSYATKKQNIAVLKKKAAGSIYCPSILDSLTFKTELSNQITELPTKIDSISTWAYHLCHPGVDIHLIANIHYNHWELVKSFKGNLQPGEYFTAIWSEGNDYIDCGGPSDLPPFAIETQTYIGFDGISDLVKIGRGNWESPRSFWPVKNGLINIGGFTNYPVDSLNIEDFVFTQNPSDYDSLITDYLTPNQTPLPFTNSNKAEFRPDGRKIDNAIMYKQNDLQINLK